MAHKIAGLLLVGLLIVALWIDSLEAQPAAKPKKKKKVSVFMVNKRLIVTEKKLQEVTEDLETTKQQLLDLQNTVASLSSKGDGGGMSYPGAGGESIAKPQRFTDLPACPGIDDFYFSADTRSCYHLEPPSVLVNYTEAVTICKEANPKSHVVSIETPTEQNFLRNKWFHERGIASISRFWTDLKKTPNRNQWKWDHNGRRLMYSHWIPTTSHDDDRFQCSAVYSNEGYFWGDVACWGPHMVTCEVDM